MSCAATRRPGPCSSAKRLEHDETSLESRGDAVPHAATLDVVRIAAAVGVDQSYDRERAWNRLAAKLP